MTEFVVMGLLPNISAGMLPTVWATSQEDAIAQAGWLITLYALGVVVGAPLQLGWRVAFMVVAAIFALATVCIALFVPHHAGDPGRTLRAELKVFRIDQVWLALGVGAIGFGGFFAVYSYVAHMVTEVAGSPAWVVPTIVILMGLGMTIGN